MTPDWLKVTTAAEYTETSVRTVRTWLNSGLRHVKVGGSIRIRREWIDEFMLNGEVRHDQVDDLVNEIMGSL